MNKRLLIILAIILLIIIAIFILLLVNILNDTTNESSNDTSSKTEDTLDNKDTEDMLNEIIESDILNKDKTFNNNDEEETLESNNDNNQGDPTFDISRKEYINKEKDSIDEDEDIVDTKGDEYDERNDIDYITKDNFDMIIICYITNRLEGFEQFINEDFYNERFNFLNKQPYRRLKGVSDFKDISGSFEDKIVSCTNLDNETYKFKFSLDSNNRLNNLEYIDKE